MIVYILVFVQKWQVLLSKTEKEWALMKDDNKRYLTISQAMHYFNIKSRNTLKKNFIAKGLPIVIINGTKRIDQVDADKFMEAHKV